MQGKVFATSPNELDLIDGPVGLQVRTQYGSRIGTVVLMTLIEIDICEILKLHDPTLTQIYLVWLGYSFFL